MTKRSLLLGTACCMLVAPTFSYAQDTVTLPEVEVQGTPDAVNEILIDLDVDVVFPIRDAGEYLKSLPGVTGVRMGGHGVDPVIRGQQQGRLSIIDDGLSVHGGCPNRMDPPSSFMSLSGNDELIVLKGYQSVQNGPGGAGGTVKTKRNAPIFLEGEKAKGNVEAGIDGNGLTREFSLDGSVNLENGDYFRVQADASEANNYEDGQGRKVRSAYNSRGGRFDIGFAGIGDRSATLGLQYDKTEDALFAGAGMDSPLSEMKGARGRFEGSYDLGFFDHIEANAYISDVEHVMDNFTLRTRNLANGALTDSETQIIGGRFALSSNDEGSKITVGSDLKFSDQEALRYFGAQANVSARAAGVRESYMWPDLGLTEIGLFGETEMDLSNQNTLKVGLRYDFVRATAGKADDVVSTVHNRSANDLYTLYYGYGWEDTTEHNIGGLIRLDHQFNNALSFYGSLARSVRTADANERGMAADANAGGTNRQWVGNPRIDPEKHHQFEIGANYSAETWSLGGSTYYNKVQDFILRDLAYGQDGILQNNGNADIYRNVDATLMGFEISGQIDITSELGFATNLAYTYGNNDEDDNALAQIAPFEITSTLEYTVSDWMAGLRMRAAAKQTRADLDATTSGLDQEQTGGYAVFDLYGKIWAFEPFEIALGATNIFDKTYSNHLNRASSFDNEVTKVNEPGRSFFLRVNAEF